MNGGNNMKRKMLSVLLAVFLAIGLFPVTALAVEGAPNSLYVGNQQVISGNDITFWTTDKSTGGLTEYEGNDDNWNVKYDPDTATLTLNGATINGAYDATSPPYGAGIYAQGSSNQPVTLTIELIGENTITGTFGIYVNATPPTTPGTDASVLIKNGNESGESGSLTVNGTNSYGIFVISGTGNASLTIENASVDAKTTQTYSSYAGVCVQSGASATGSPQLSLAVNGGSLTASGSGGNDGIQFYVGSSEATGATTSLSVTDQAILDARNGGISADGVNITPIVNIGSTGSTGGIVFDGTEGTVYGDVTLQEDLEIGEGESLTIPNGSSLNGNGKLTNNGTIVNTGGTLTGDPGGTIVSAPAIITETLPEGTVGESYTATLEATGNNITWSASDLPDGLTLNSDGTITGIPTTAGTSTFTVTATNDAGGASKEYTLTIKPAAVPVTGVTLDKSALSLFPGESETLTAAVAPDDATNQDVTWESSDPEIATVTDGEVTAVKAGTATITVTTADGGYTASCKVTVTDMAYSLSAEPSAIDFGTVKTGYTQPGAKTVTVTNTGNQSLTLEQPKADHFDIGELSQTELAPGESATFTVQPKAKLPFGTFNDSISISGSRVIIAMMEPEEKEPSDASTTITAQFTVEKRTAATTDDNKDQISSPQTGDDSNLLLWGVLALVALAGMVTVLVMMKRKK
jgi:LPXTG-motif cell wall-anchored protein